jgi:hypothetical protein
MTKRSAYNYIKNMALNKNGIIYGGFVRDEMISQYYTNKFQQTHGNVPDNCYWNNIFSVETVARLLVPNDIDICFHSNVIAEEFINSVCCDTHFSKVIISAESNTGYYSSAIKSVQTLYIYVEVGGIPFYSKRTTLILQVDVVIPHNPIFPPFGNLDMLCNAFIITKTGGTLFSNNTGTVLDKYDYKDKAKIISDIKENLLLFKTHICFVGDIYTNNNRANLLATRRILKMHSKDTPWTFLNLPFKTTIETNHVSDKKECIICMSEFIHGEIVAFTSNEGCKMHYKCFMKYLLHKYIDLNKQNHGACILRCPYRSIIDFRDCSNNVFQ